MSGSITGFSVGPGPGQVAPGYAYAGIFGTGADGNVTVTSTVTLTRDMHYRNLTISGAGKLVATSFRVYVQGTLDISAAAAGAITNNAATGISATGSTTVGIPNPPFAGSSTLFCSPWGGQASGVGGTTTGGNGAGSSSAQSGNGGMGGQGGGGGASGSYAGGSAPGVNTAYPWSANIQFPAPISVFQVPGAGNTAAAQLLGGGNAGGNGGGGGGDGTNLGGAGGSGAGASGMLAIYARIVQRGTNTTAGIIQAKGAQGGQGGPGASAGSTAGGGGGGGSGGGFVYLVTEALYGATIPGAIDVSGGSGGTGGAGYGTGKGGTGGSGGNSGNVQVVNLGAPSFTCSSFNAAGAAGGTTTSTAGGTPGAGATLQVAL